MEGRHWHVNIILCFPRNKAEEKNHKLEKRDLNCMISIYFLHVSNILSILNVLLPRFIWACLVFFALGKFQESCLWAFWDLSKFRIRRNFTKLKKFKKRFYRPTRILSFLSLHLFIYSVFFNNKKRLHIIRKLYFSRHTHTHFNHDDVFKAE